MTVVSPEIVKGLNGLKVVDGGDGYAIADNLTLIPVGDGFMPVLYVLARGCAQGRFPEGRISRWNMVSECEFPNARPGYRNSYMCLKPDPENPYDANAIEVLAKGEAFGCMGYVAKEMTDSVRYLSELTKTDIESLHVAVANHKDVGNRVVSLLVWA